MPDPGRERDPVDDWPYRNQQEVREALIQTRARLEATEAALRRIEEWTWEPGYELIALDDIQKIASAALRDEDAPDA